jgi:hypothetical protein
VKEEVEQDEEAGKETGRRKRGFRARDEKEGDGEGKDQWWRWRGKKTRV